MKYHNARAASLFAAGMFRKGHAAMIWPNRYGTALLGVIPERFDLDKIETGTRAGYWDDFDEFGWQYAS